MIGSAGVDYQIQVYKNPKLDEGVVKDPESGTPMLESPVTGMVSYAGVYTVEEFDPDPYMEALNKWGLPWQESHAPVLVE